jgi:peptide-methionine (R)-S-oxide reductase
MGVLFSLVYNARPEKRFMKPKPKVECAGCESPGVPVEALPASEAEWRAKLTPEQFYVLRQGGTERPYTGAYLHHREDGLYACAGCAQPLYDSKTKYDACGWPSFWDAIPGAVGARDDGGAVEAVCSRCRGHLGHIFDDGPPPTGKRH